MKVIRSASRAVGYLSVATVIALMLLTVADVFLRYVFNSPIRGTIELTEMMMVWILLVVAWGALEGSHVKIDILMSRFSPRVQATVEIFTFLVSLGIYAVIVWQGVVAAVYAFDNNVKSTMLSLPESVSWLLFSLGFTALCLAIASLIFQRIKEVAKR